jgi:hypothetical protein
MNTVETRRQSKALRISATSIDRSLTPERRKQRLRDGAGTKPGALLKKRIPPRTFAEWDEQCLWFCGDRSGGP